MYCPICSTKVSAAHKFCRSCGFGLEKTAQSVSEQHHTELTRNLEERKSKLERLGVVALSVFGLGVIGFFLYMVGYKFISLYEQGRIWGALGLIGLVVVLGCGLLFVILFAKAKDIQEATNKRGPAQLEETPTKVATAKLLPERDLIVPSVVERTTELLFTDDQSIKRN